MTDFFDTVQDHIDREQRSCLVCMALRSHDHATVAVCDLHPTIRIDMVCPRDGYTEAAIRRAKRCKDWEGEE